MKKLTTAAALAFVVALTTLQVSARSIISNPTPLRGAQDDKQKDDKAKEETDAYTAWYNATRETNKDWSKIMELGKAYMAKYPQGQWAKYIQPSIAQARNAMLTKAAQDKNVAEIIRLGKEAAAEDQSAEVDYYTFIVGQIGTLELFAQPPSFAHAADATDLANKSIALIEGGKLPKGANKNVLLAYLNSVDAVVEKNNKNTDKAIAYYQKAASYDPTNPQYSLQCGSLHQQKYAAAATKFQTIPDTDREAEADKMKPEVKAVLDEVNREADAVIQCWARFVALTQDKKEWDGTRAQVQKVLTELYSFRHNGSSEGLKELIERSRSASSPPSSSTASH
ncbi:MAG TPA: hypothetical protein VKM94_22425 [Blastocatellia bacterium]|nr:hypothetical protein [Blastocatellia bacterium]